MKPSKRLQALWALNLSLVPSVLASATCSELSGRDYIGPNNKNFEILCDTSTVGGHITAYYSNGDEFQDCVDRCDSDSVCIVALYLSGSGDCALIDSYQGTRSFAGNDVAIVRPATIPTTTSVEPTSAEATITETTSSEDSTATSLTAEVSSTDSSTAEPSTEPSTAESSTVVPSSVEAPSTESSAAESSTVALSWSETTSSDVTSAEGAMTESSTTDASISQSSTNGPSSSEPSSTSPEPTLATTTDSPYTSTANIETSTDDCEDETSTYETPTTVIDSTSTETASGVEFTTLSAHSESSSTTVSQSSEPFTSPSSVDSTTASLSSSTTTGTQGSIPVSLSSSVTSQEVYPPPASSMSAVTQIYTTHSLAPSVSGSSSSETQKPGSVTLSTSGVTIMKTTTEHRLPTYLPASDCVWTVYLTMVKYVTCSTGVVPETSTTATYVTVDGNAGTHAPPVVQLPDGCIGGYQVDASGNSYPVVRPTIGSQGSPLGETNHPSVRPTLASSGGSHPSYKTGQYHVPAPTAGSQATALPEEGTGNPSVEPTHGSQGNVAGSKSQPPVSDQDSPEPIGGEPNGKEGEAAPTAISAYRSGTPAYPSLSSPIHQGQHNVSMTFTVKTATTGEVQGHSVSSALPTEAPSTPVIASGSIRHQSTLWASITGALLVLNMFYV